MRGDQLARQWLLIQRLARSRAGAGLEELTEELGCVGSSIKRFFVSVYGERRLLNEHSVINLV